MPRPLALWGAIRVAVLTAVLPALALAQARVAESPAAPDGDGGGGWASGLLWLIVPAVFFIGFIAVMIATMRTRRGRRPQTPARQT